MRAPPKLLCCGDTNNTEEGKGEGGRSTLLQGRGGGKKEKNKEGEHTPPCRVQSTVLNILGNFVEVR